MKFLTPILYDPQLALSKEEQILVVTAVKRQFGKKGIGRFLFPLAFFAWGFTVLAGFIYIGQSNISRAFLLLYMFVSFPLGTLPLGYLLIRFGFTPLLNQELHDRGYDLCIKCSYILIDVPQEHPVCPECGTTRTPLPNTPKVDKPYD